MKLFHVVALSLLLTPALALGAVGPRDAENYRAMDSLAPDPALPSSMLDLMTGTSHSGEFTGLEDDGDHYLDFGSYGSTSVYGYSDFAFHVHTNGIITSAS